MRSRDAGRVADRRLMTGGGHAGQGSGAEDLGHGGLGHRVGQGRGAEDMGPGMSGRRQGTRRRAWDGDTKGLGVDRTPC